MVAVLEVRGLEKVYAPGVRVGPISLSVEEGEFVSLLGPSGCGKTTTLRCIAGFERMTSGEIYLANTRIDQLAPNKRDLGLVFQNYALFPHLTVFDNVAFGLKLRRKSKAEITERVRRTLELVALNDLGERRPDQLSGGQQQRVAIARSLVLEPRVLMFDEPLSNLDLKLRVQMRQELRDLQRRLGKTSIYVTHDQGEALALSDRIAVLSRGNIEQVGTPTEIYQHPATRFVAEFIGNSNILDAVVVGGEAGMIELEVPGVARLKAAGSGVAAGERVSVLLRPERLRVHARNSEPHQSETTGCIPAKVEDIVFLGEDLEIRLRVGDIALKASAKNSKRLHALQTSQPVDALFDFQDLHLLRS